MEVLRRDVLTRNEGRLADAMVRNTRPGLIRREWLSIVNPA
jgi:hypothetical protein